ncbi:hypothetical protein L3X37_07385 [Sabulilitoribacter arenilitoris]|uniref:Uncharacterized protein n=1 Tax=Wocania arenilitoris TaxID=2044858 RepID=A0AAE3EQA3_9FLAO|nr:hypothetical protein [Wocania arenilitoris]MCF7568184.1 hypothetical protein [Wocania arenilitoris]
MILKGFKEKSNKKHLNKLLLEREVSVTDTKVESLGLILNIDEIDDFDLFRTLADYINVRPNKLKIIAFSSKKKDNLNTWDECYSPKDFGWKGRIKNIELQSFLNTKFDTLISYYTKDDLELKFLTVKSKAKFKIGILQTDARLNDLIIKTSLKEFDVFKAEVYKYLTILNKIKE